MIVYGGQTENGMVSQDMIVFHMDTSEWVKIQLKNGPQTMLPVIQGGACAVIPPRNLNQKDQFKQRKSDAIQDGVYYFGGKQGDGKLVNKLRYFKPVTVDRKVVQGEFIPIKTSGEAPCPRFGHTMSYLPINSAIVIAGGRNDSLCKENVTPLLNDIHLFLLDQKVWIKVKFSFNSNKLDFIGNHTMGVLTDGDSFEKIVIFGGI